MLSRVLVQNKQLGGEKSPPFAIKNIEVVKGR